MTRTPLKTPNLPYYSVTTTASHGEEIYDRQHHFKLGEALYSEADKIDGFLGWEVLSEEGFSVATTYWQSLEAIETWRHRPGHSHAKQLGRKWFNHCITRIALVERDYGFERTE